MPFISGRALDNESVAASLGWFPLVGFAIAVALSLEDLLLARFFDVTVRSILIVLSLTIVTGALHLDGLADTADALGAGRDRERALVILRDSRIGSFGAVGDLLRLGAQGRRARDAGRSAPLHGDFRGGGSRAMGDGSGRPGGFPICAPSGAGSAILASGSEPRNLTIASLTVVAAMLPLASRTVLGAILAAIAITLAIRAFYRRWLGGVTGDLIGACGELVEIAVLLIFAR